MKKGNIIVSAIFGMFAILIIAASMTLEKSQDGVPGPGTWPIAISVLVLVASISLFISALKMNKEDDTSLGFTGADPKRVYITMVGLVLYLIAMYFIGFAVATFFMLFIYISWYGSYKWYYNIITAVVITSIVYFTFKSILHVPFRFGFLF